MELMVRTPSQIGAALRRVRRAAGLNQTELSQKSNLWQETISKIENGASSTKLDTLCNLLAALDLELVVRSRTKANPSDIEDMF